MKKFAFMRMPIKKKMMWISMSTILLALIFVSVGLIIGELIFYRNHLLEEITTQAKIIGTNSAAALAFNDSRDAQEILSALHAEPNIIYVILYDKNNKIFAKYLRNLHQQDYPQIAPSEEGYHFGTNHLVLTQRINFDHDFIGSILIKSDLSQLYSRLFGHVLTIILVMAISLAIAFILSMKLQQAVINPVLELVKLMKAISQEKKYSLRAKVYNQDEIGALAEGFNEMLNQIESRDSELESHRHNLEKQVIQRTDELARANKKLAQELQERRKAEESLREREKFLEDVFASIQDGIYVLDMNFNIVRANPTMESRYPTARPLVGKKCYEAFHGLNYPCTNCPSVMQTMKTGKAATGEINIKDEEGKIMRWLELHSFPLADKESGQVKGVIEYSRDITQRKRMEEEKRSLEEQLLQSQKMEAIGRLAGAIAHDFNNLLTVILGYTQLTRVELNPGSSWAMNLEQVQKAAEKAQSLTRQLLAFSRRQIMELKVIDLNSLLRDLEKMLQRLLPENIDLIFQLQNNLGKIKVDPHQIEQVVLNLTVNAKDAMPEGGRLIISTSNLELGNDAHLHDPDLKAGQYVKLTVADTGIGMTPEVKEKIFEPFFTTKEKGKGTGLGLATVFGIVKQSKGGITVDSNPGKGSSFNIYFPLVVEELSSHEKRGAEQNSYRGQETILIVEDEPAVRKLAAHILKNLGYQVLEAANGEEALLFAKENSMEKIHLLFTDIVMPKMGGRELAEKIVSFYPQIKILYSSGYTDDFIFLKNLGNPEVFFLEKPFSAITLARKVREVLDFQPISHPS